VKDIFSVWGKTRQIVLIAITAAIYAGALIPFKAIQIIPGLTELRPASVFPVIFGIMFGPAAAWGSAIGNLIADFFGMLSPASAFGFLGNFLYAYIPFLIWRALIKEEVTMNLKQILVFILACLAASAACALTVAGGASLFKLAPFKVLLVIIFVNNFLMSSVLGIILMKLLYKRLEKTGLMYDNKQQA
jgi:energy-coupling factor transport system substrate-specific component